MAWSGCSKVCIFCPATIQEPSERTSKSDVAEATRHRYAKLGTEMRLFFSLVAVVTLGQAAIAQGQECKAITDPSMRLACYDKRLPPVATTRAPRPAVPTDPTSEVDATKYVDPIGAEDALLHERINGICRGC
jgi:hypothetical protein